MYCSNCKKTLPDNATFCDTCGGRLESDKSPDVEPLQNSVSSSPNSGYQANLGYHANPSTSSYNPSYNNPPPVYSAQPVVNNQMTTGKWLGVFLINIIPLIGQIIFLILLFVWAFGSCKYPSLKSYAKATLILILIGIIISIVFGAVLAPMMSDLMEQFGGNMMFDY